MIMILITTSNININTHNTSIITSTIIWPTCQLIHFFSTVITCWTISISRSTLGVNQLRNELVGMFIHHDYHDNSTYHNSNCDGDRRKDFDKNKISFKTSPTTGDWEDCDLMVPVRERYFYYLPAQQQEFISADQLLEENKQEYHTPISSSSSKSNQGRRVDVEDESAPSPNVKTEPSPLNVKTSGGPFLARTRSHRLFQHQPSS